MRTFRSDNNAGLCPEAVRAMVACASASHEIGYGDDEVTGRAIAQFKRLFGDNIAVFFVATGTAANTLAVASLTQPWQRVLCHAHSHWNDDESTAPERVTNCRTTTIHTPRHQSKLTPDDVLSAAGAGARGDVHQPQPGVLTMSNVTEFGTVYTPSELRALTDVAHKAGYRVHIDGARFANAVARVVGNDEGARDNSAAVQAAARSLAGDAGVDAISFGGTKNGLAYGEAVVFLPQAHDGGASHQRAVQAFEFHRKSTGHLLSKHRFVSGPFEVCLKDGAWIRHAAHANRMAQRLAVGLRALGLEPAYPVEANAVFVSLPARFDAALKAAGHGYYPFGDPSWNLIRLMCAFDTTVADVDALLDDVRRAMA